MSAWLLCTGKGEEVEYFTGRHRGHRPFTTPFKSDGFHFSTPRAAYEAAETHEALRGSDQWRVVRR